MQPHVRHVSKQLHVCTSSCKTSMAPCPLWVTIKFRSMCKTLLFESYLNNSDLFSVNMHSLFWPVFTSPVVLPLLEAMACNNASSMCRFGPACPLCMCVCVCVCVCEFNAGYIIHTHTHAHTHMHTHSLTHTCTHTHAHTLSHTHMHIHTHMTHTYAHTLSLTHTCTHTYAHTHTHTHTQHN